MTKTRTFFLTLLVASMGGYIFYLQSHTGQKTQQYVFDDMVSDSHASRTEPQSAQAVATEPPQEPLLIGHPIEFSHVWRNTVLEQKKALDLVTSKNFIEELKNVIAWDEQDVALWQGTFHGQIQFDQPNQISPKVEVQLDTLASWQRRFHWKIVGSAAQTGRTTETQWQDDGKIPFPLMSKYKERDETSYIFGIDYNGQTAYAHMFSPSTDPNYFVGIIYVASEPDIIQRVGTVWLKR